MHHFAALKRLLQSRFALGSRFPESAQFCVLIDFDWLHMQLLGAIYVNIVYHSWICCNYRDYHSHFWPFILCLNFNEYDCIE